MSEGSRVLTPFLANEIGVSEFDHPGWEKAEPVHIHRLWSGAEVPSSRHAEVRLVWSPQALTARFVCQQHEPLIVNSSPQLEQKTIGLWHNDVCEMFLAPTSETPQRYFEFEVSPTGEWLDLAIDVCGDDRDKDWDFQSGMSAGARVQGDRVIIGMRLPWCQALPKPKVGDVWRVNLFRCIGLGHERYLAWQPTGTREPYFHEPEAFGSLEFE